MRLLHCAIACLVLIAICEAFNDKGKDKDHSVHKDKHDKGSGRKNMRKGKGMGKGNDKRRDAAIIGQVITFILRHFPKLKDVVVGSESDAKAKPCVQLECPPYKVVTRGYEERCYSKSKWILTSTYVEKSMSQGDGMGFLITMAKIMDKIREYIQGGNKDNANLTMTAPVLHKFVLPAKGGRPIIHLYYYVPSEYQGSVPVPNNSSLSVVDMEMCVYSHSYKNPAFVIKPQEYINHVRMLQRFLKRDGLENTYENEFFYSAQYDRLVKKENRRNEIWLQKKKMSPVH